MPFLAHLEELRKRVLRSVIAVAIAFAVCYYFSGPILLFFLAPIRDSLFDGGDIVFRQITEPFLIYLKVAFLAALFASSPYVFLEIWGFVSPGLRPNEKRWALPFVVGSSGLFLAGGLFGYYVLLPMTCRFLLGIGDDFEALLDLRSAFAFEAWLLLGLGIVFQIPVLIALLARAGLVTAGWLWRQFRYAVLAIFVIAAVLTPTPDVVTQVVFAAPMIALYLLGILIAAVMGRG
jgi:sec-independent protein translocase protein TatC